MTPLRTAALAAALFFAAGLAAGAIYSLIGG